MCTGIRFTDGQGNMYFGRNLDWSCGYGEHVVITPTGWSPNSPFGAIDAISRPVYGMGIVAENTPLYFDCANDAGLAQDQRVRLGVPPVGGCQLPYGG